MTEDTSCKENDPAFSLPYIFSADNSMLMRGQRGGPGRDFGTRQGR